ncbi:hypothetical protein MHYP_G00173350 [Metynnis hypsauchen]
MFFLTETLQVSQKEGTRATLYCGKLTNGKVTWSRDINGQRVDILTTHNGEMTKHVADPDRRYSSGANIVLIISRVSQSDRGRYYCSGATVELTVTSGGHATVSPRPFLQTSVKEEDTVGGRVVQTVLMYAGVCLAGLIFLLTTVTVGRVIHHQAWLEGWKTGRGAVQLR